MKNHLGIFIWVLALGCSAASSPGTDPHIETQSISSVPLDIESESSDTEGSAQSEIASSDVALPQVLKDRLGAHLHSFVETGLVSYECDIIDQYYEDYGTKLNTSGLVQIDSVSCVRLFNQYQNQFGGFCYSYFYSIDQPVNGFFPITVIQDFGVAERPLIMVLFNESGDIVNSIEVADSYGETGGCLSSQRINDSTLIQQGSYPDFGIDEVTGEDVWETEYVKTQITIRSTGEIIEEELERSRSVDD